MKTLSLCATLLAFLPLVQAQELAFETTYQFETHKKNCYLGEVSISPDDEGLALHYVQKNSDLTSFYSYYFDKDLKFVEEQQENVAIQIEKQSFGDALKALGEEWKNAFNWFTDQYKGEVYTEERIHIFPGNGGSIVARKYRYTYAYGWDFGRYHPKIDMIDQVDFKGAKAEKVYLYDWVQNNATGDVFLIVGVKAPKGSKIKFQHARKFQIIKMTRDFELEYLETISFKYNMAINFMRVLSNEPADYDLDTNIPQTEDISRGPLVIVFSPVKGIFGKKNQSDHPETQKIVLLNEEGGIAAKINFRAKVSGWVIEDFILSPDGNDFYLYGPAKEDAYVNQVMPTNSPLTNRDEIKDIKWKSFQLLKVSNHELAWVRDTDLKAFKEKAVAPPSQKQMPIYKGQKFEKTMTYVSPEGEVFIGGQNYTTKKITTEDGYTRKIVDNYKDLVLFHFSSKGELKAQYGVRRDKMNSYSKAILTPQSLVLKQDETSLIWIYGEIKGFRGGLTLSDVATGGSVPKAYLQYYPAVSKINLKSGKVGDFVMMGQDEEGKQKYYAHPDFDYLLSPDAQHLTFIGEDKKGTALWLGRMEL